MTTENKATPFYDALEKGRGKKYPKKGGGGGGGTRKIARPQKRNHVET